MSLGAWALKPPTGGTTSLPPTFTQRIPEPEITARNRDTALPTEDGQLCQVSQVP